MDERAAGTIGRADGCEVGTLKKTSYHHKDLRNSLQDVALRFIAERNGADFSLRELGEALGVSHASVYRHFADKAALLEALTARGFDMLHACQEEEQAKAPPDSRSQLRALNEAYIRFARENVGAFWLMFGASSERASSAKKREGINAKAFVTLVDAVRRCQEDGHLIQGDPRRIAGYLVMAPHGFACYSARDREMIGLDDQLMSAQTVAAIAIMPLLTHPPSQEEILGYFAAEHAPSPRTMVDP